MKLVIVESPTKAKTIEKFLGKEYEVTSSYGHLRDLPKSKLGIDLENNFTPQYVIPRKAQTRVTALKKTAAKASEVILATDEDREGEAIAWHLAHILGLENPKSEIRNPKKNLTPNTPARSAGGQHLTPNPQPIQRIVFHEITKPAIEAALQNPRALNMQLVDAQQGRRVLDRLVGYKLSPFLWKKVARGLSAGRVQSVALRLIVEREAEIMSFTPEAYFTIAAKLATGKEAVFTASLQKIDGKPTPKPGIPDRKTAEQIVAHLKQATFTVQSVEEKLVHKNPLPPFTTSTLQQTAAARLGFSAKKTMVIAQSLYEQGHITYMRTDSTNISNEALLAARAWIETNLPKTYLLEAPRRFKTKSRLAQEAHEAIRPTTPGRAAESLKLGRDETRLYDLISRRFMASQLPPADVSATRVEITAQHEVGSESSILHPQSYTLVANGSVLKFDGFLKIWPAKLEENELPRFEKNETLSLREAALSEHMTEPPPRFNEATLIKTLEENGIGRPSTYAPTISVIQDRGYVEKIDRRLKPTDVGTLVNKVLVEHFPEIVDVGFTAQMENELDDVAEGKKPWQEVISAFYAPFSKTLAIKEADVEREVQESAIPCPHCEKMMIVKFGRFGKFLACPDPESKVTLPMPEEQEQIKALEAKTQGELCPLCDKQMQVKRGRFGFFLGCSDYPLCKGISKIWNKTGFKCPACEASAQNPQSPARHGSQGDAGGSILNPVGDIVEKKSRGRGKPFYACTRYPDCTFVMNKKPESEDELKAAFEHWKAHPPTPRRSRFVKTNPPALSSPNGLKPRKKFESRSKNSVPDKTSTKRKRKAKESTPPETANES